MFLRSLHVAIYIIILLPLSAARYSTEGISSFHLSIPLAIDNQITPSTDALIQVPYERVSFSGANTQKWDFGYSGICLLHFSESCRSTF